MTHVFPFKDEAADRVRSQVFDKRAATEAPATATGGGLSDGDYGDVTVSGGGAAIAIDAGAVTYAKMQNVSATSRVLGRKTSGAGDVEECTLSEILDFIGSAAQGDILFRDASAWARLAAGTSGHFLKTQGAGANPVWAAASGGGGGSGSITRLGRVEDTAGRQIAGTMPYDSTNPINTDGTEYTQLALTGITPASATSYLLGIVKLSHWSTNAQPTAVMAVYQSGVTNALDFIAFSYTGNEFSAPPVLIYMVASGSTSSRDYTVRMGCNNGATININRVGSSSTLFNNGGKQFHVLFEIAP